MSLPTYHFAVFVGALIYDAVFQARLKMIRSLLFPLVLLANTSNVLFASAQTASGITTTIYPSPNPSTTSSNILGNVLSSLIVGADTSSVKTNSDITTTVGTATLGVSSPTRSITNVEVSTGSASLTTTLAAASPTGAAQVHRERAGGVVVGIAGAVALGVVMV